jgi:DNA-binding transcriptional MerR regulator
MIKLDDLAAQTGATKAMIALYVALGLLPKPIAGPDEATAGASVFPAGAAARIRAIDALRKQGLSLVDISLKLRDEPLPDS